MEKTDVQKRILAAKVILFEPATTRAKFSSVRSLIEGINPGLDKTLKEVDEAFATVEKVLGGEVIQLTAENLPEETEEQKKRKRALLFFISTWNKLKGEVARVERELESSQQGDAVGQTSAWGKIFAVAKGPLGIITIAAVGIVLAMQFTSVKITIANEGCGTMQTSATIPVSLPGLSIPSDPIPSGGRATATIPPLPITVDGTREGVLTLNSLKFSASFQLPGNISDVTLNEVSLLGKKTDVSLSDRKDHLLVLSCR